MKSINYVIVLLLINFLCFSQYPEVVVQTGHSAEINSVCFSPDGKYIASGSVDNTIKLWDVYSGNEIRTLKGHTFEVSSVCFTPDGKYLVSGGGDAAIKLWDISTGNEIRTFSGHKRTVMSISISFPDGKYIASGGEDSTIKLWDISSGSLIWSIKGHAASVDKVSFSPDGKYLASGGMDNKIKLWNAANGNEIRTFIGHTYWISSISFSNDGAYIASGDWDGKILIWEVNTGDLLKTITVNKYNDPKKFIRDHVSSVSFSPDGKYIVSGSSDDTVKLWDVSDCKEIMSFSGHSSDIYSVCFSPDGKYIASGSHDRSIILWDAASGKEIRTFKSNWNDINSVSFSPDDKYIVNGCFDNTVKLWDVSRSCVIRIFKGHQREVESVCFSPDGKFIASGDNDNIIKIWDVTGVNEIRTLKGHSSWIKSVCFSPDGKYLASGGLDDTIRLWDVLTGKEIRKFIGHKEPVESVCFSPDGKYLASGGWDSTIILWNVSNGKIIRKFLGHSYMVIIVRFSPNGKSIVSGGDDNTVRFWNVSSGKEIANFKISVKSICFSPDSKYIAFGCWDNTMYVLNPSDTGVNRVRSFVGHSSKINSISFSPDSKYIVSGSWDGTIKYWNVETSEVIATLISIDQNDWISVTPDNYYSCSKNGINAIAFRVGNRAFSPEQFDLQYNRPDIVLERIGRTDPEIITAYREAYKKRLKKMNFTEDMFSKDFHLPETKILTEDIPVSSDKKEFIFKFNCVEDKTEYKLDRVNLFVNDVPVYGMAGINLRDRMLNDFDTTLGIELLEGKNKIQLSCLNDKGVESLKETFEIAYSGPEVLSKTYYVGIGVANYLEPHLNLKYAVKDVEDMAAAFSLNSNSEVITLTNEQATKENILALKEKLMQTKVNDEVIISFSGHGFLSKDYDFYFATYDIDYRNPKLKGISYDELESLLDGIPARKKLLLIDACHSGEIDKEEVEIKQTENIADNVKGFEIEITEKESKLGLKNSFELMQELFANLSRGSGAVVISAAGGKEYAFEGNQWNNGVFTYCVLKGLKEKEADLDKNGTITVNELKSYVSEQVEKLTAGRQKPTSRRENLEYDWNVW